MAFDNTNKANVAFKNLQNKSHTDSSKEIGAEADSIFFNIDSTTIFTDTIDPNPVTAIADGIALQVTAELVYDTSSNDQAWKAVWPNPLPAGAPDGVLPGDRVTNSISAAYGIPYEAKPYGVDDALISPGDPRDWIYQYQSGIFYQQTLFGPLPKEIIVYVYTGTYLNDALENTGSGDVSSINYAASNMDMQCEVATIGQKVTAKSVIEFPISDSLVKLNGVQINVGPTKDCYFSPDGVYIRPGASAAKGDYLYWNSDKYDLDAIDEVDFVYMVQAESIVAGSGDTITIDDNTSTQNIQFTGELGETANVTLGSTTILVGNVAGNFVWDIGEIQEHTFTEPNTYIEVIYSSIEYVIWYDGAGSLLFSLRNITPVLDDYGLTSLSTTTRGDLACNNGLSFTPYDVTDVKIKVDNGPELTCGSTSYTGLTCTLLDKVSTTIDGDYAFGNDSLDTYTSTDPETPGPDPILEMKVGRSGDYLYFLDQRSDVSHNERWGYYYPSTNECTWISVSDLDSGGSHEITGDPYPTGSSAGMNLILEHPVLNIMYFASYRAVWELNMDTMTGTMIMDRIEDDIHINSLSIDITDGYLYIGTSLGTLPNTADGYRWDMNLRSYSLIPQPDSGDDIGTSVRSIEVSPDGDYLAIHHGSSPNEILLLEKGTSTIGYSITNTNTSIGGSYEVIGDPMPTDLSREAFWASDANNDQILISKSDANLWLWNIETNVAKIFDTVTTGVNGIYEVNGDPMPSDLIVDVCMSDDFHKLYFTSANGIWVYDFITNTGVAYNNTTLTERNSNLDTLSSFDFYRGWSSVRSYSLAVLDDNIYIGNILYAQNANGGIFVIRPDEYTKLDYAWFEDNEGNRKSKYSQKQGDKLHWNSHKSGYNLTGSELLDFKYYI